MGREKLFVQVMGYAMALTAFGEILVHAFRMGLAVTGGALRNHLMLFLMAGSAGDLRMGSWVGLEEGHGIRMTAGAAGRRYVGRISNLQRHMGLMAGQAVFLDHLFTMW